MLCNNLFMTLGPDSHTGSSTERATVSRQRERERDGTRIESECV